MSDDVYSDDGEFVEEEASLSFTENHPEDVGQDASYSTQSIQVLSTDEQQLDEALAEHGRRTGNSSRTIAAALNSPPLSPTHRSFSPSSSKSHSRLSSSLQRSTSASHRNTLSQQLASDPFNFENEFQSMLSLQPPSSSPLKPDVETYEMQFDEADDSGASSSSEDIFNHPDALQILNPNNESSQYAPLMSRTEKDPVVARLLNRVKRKQKEEAIDASRLRSVLQPSHILQATVGSKLSTPSITALCSRAHTASQTASKLPLFAPEPPRPASVTPSAILSQNRLSGLAVEWNRRQRESFPISHEKENIQNTTVFDEFPRPAKAAYSALGQPLSLLASQLKANAAVDSLRTHQFGQQAQQLPVAKTKFQDMDLPRTQPVSANTRTMSPHVASASNPSGAIFSSQSNLDGLLNHLYKQRMNPPTNEMASNQQQIADALFLQHNSIHHCLQVFRQANTSQSANEQRSLKYHENGIVLAE